MNTYITLDGNKYATARNWTPQITKPATVRELLDGTTDATYGPSVVETFSGEIIVHQGEARAGYGTRAQLETSLKKLQAISFTDHEGNSSYVHVKFFKRRSLGPVWDASSNKHYYEVVLRIENV